MGAGDVVFVAEQVRAAGIYGAIILVLMMVVGVLSGVIAVQWRHSNKVYGYRLAERDTLNKTISESKTAMREMLASMEDRNDITKELSAVIQKQAATFEILIERFRNWFDNMEKEHVRQAAVIAAQAEAMRQIVGIITDCRNAITNTQTDVSEIKRVMPTFLQELKVVIDTLPRRARRA